MCHTADEDYTSYTFSIRLEIGETAICRNGTMLRDSLVEGTENFILQFSSTDPPNIALNADSGSNIIRTQIFIEDSTGTGIHRLTSIQRTLSMCLWCDFSTVFELQFESSFYEVSESAGSLEVCLQVIETSEVATGVAVDVLIVEVSDEPLGIVHTCTGIYMYAYFNVGTCVTMYTFCRWSCIQLARSATVILHGRHSALYHTRYHQ